MTTDPRPPRTLVASVLFVDLVEFSRASDTEQIEVKRELTRILRGILSSIPEDDYRLMDTGDGAALGFIADPEHALYFALAIDSACNGSDPLSGFGAGALRIGINLGPVKEVVDVNNRPGLIGDGMNTARRIVGFAEPGQITISRSFYELVSRLAPEYQDIFVHVGEHDDKHGREHDIYVLKPARDILGKIQERLQLNVAEATGINVVFARTAEAAKAAGAGAGASQRAVLWPKPPIRTTAEGRGSRRRRFVFAVAVAIGLAIVAWSMLMRMETREPSKATTQAPAPATSAPATTDAATAKPSAATVPAAPPSTAPTQVAAPASPGSATSKPADSAPAVPTPAAAQTEPTPTEAAKGAAAAAATPGKRPSSATGAPKAAAGEEGAPKSGGSAPAGRGTYTRCSSLMQKMTIGEALTPAERREMEEFCR